MSLEFVWLYSPSKKIHIDWFYKKENLYGSLIDKPIKSVKSMMGDNDYAFLLSNEDINVSANSFFDGNYIHNKKLGSNYEPVDLDDYFLFTQKARGTFCLAYAYMNSLCEKVIRFSNDVLGMYPLLYWTDGENIIVTNSPILSETVVRYALKINLERGFSHIANEIITLTHLDHGPYDGMRFLPFDSEMIVDNKGHIAIKRRYGDDFFYRPKEDESILLDRALIELIENIEGIASSSQKIKVADITGGFDSRLVLALILKAGVQDNFYFNTNGKYPSPDANVANYIIEKYGLKKIDLTSIPYKRENQLSKNILHELTTFVYASSGMKNAIDRHLSTLFTNKDILSVGGGYSAYKANKSKSIINKKGLQEAISLICSGSFSLPSNINNEVKEIVGDKLEEWILQQGMNIYDVLDRFHIEYRARFHIGLGEHWSRICQPKIHPLQSPALVRLAFKVGYKARVTDELLFMLMEKLSPPLCLIPFENRVWKKQAYQKSELRNKIASIKPITLKSKKLYEIEPIKEKVILEVSANPISIQEDRNINELNAKISVTNDIYKRWEQEQRKLGRKWFWYKLGDIKRVFDYLIAQPSLKSQNEFLWMQELGSKKLSEFKSIKEVIELHALTCFLIFYNKKESEIRVSYM